MTANNPARPGTGTRPGDNATAGVALLMGDPKKAIIKLSGPMIAAMLLMSTYNIVNAIWVAGLGSDALAAVGFVTPLFMILMGLSNGLGAGVASVISRRIGAKDKTGADNAAVHALLLVLILSAVFTIPLMLLTGPIVTLFGAGKLPGLQPSTGRSSFWGWSSSSSPTSPTQSSGRKGMRNGQCTSWVRPRS